MRSGRTPETIRMASVTAGVAGSLYVTHQEHDGPDDGDDRRHQVDHEQREATRFRQFLHRPLHEHDAEVAEQDDLKPEREESFNRRERISRQGTAREASIDCAGSAHVFVSEPERLEQATYLGQLLFDHTPTRSLQVPRLLDQQLFALEKSGDA